LRASLSVCGALGRGKTAWRPARPLHTLKEAGRGKMIRQAGRIHGQLMQAGAGQQVQAARMICVSRLVT